MMLGSVANGAETGEISPRSVLWLDAVLSGAHKVATSLLHCEGART